MKTTRFLNMMAASLVGVAFMSCSSQDDVLTPAGQTYTMSVTAQKGGDGTRALNLDGNTLNATWTEGDVVKVYNSASTELGELTAQTAGKSTTLSGTLTTLPENGATLTLKYLSPSYSTQDGTLTGADNSIDKVCDYATATVTATVSGTNVTTGAAEFQNQQAVVKFTLKDKDGNALPSNPTAFTINDGTDDIVTLTDIPAETYTANGAGVLFVAIPGFTEKTITLTATVGSDTYTCTTSEAKTLGNGKYYGVTAMMAKQASVPTGALSGEFTINSNGDKVYFSKGNLQYDGTNWKFADSQWEVLGANGTATGYPMDLFTWGNIDSPAYDGYPYVTGSANLSGDTDWGIRMGSGWRTLSGTAEGEWFYLFNTRTVNGGTGNGYCYTSGQSVNGKLGVVIYPDNYAGDLYTTGANWSTFEAAGCVFLPAAGFRNGASVSDVGNYGGYWSSTANSEYSAWMVDFDNMGNWNANNAGASYYGHSVRLVRDVAAPAPATDLSMVDNAGAARSTMSTANCYMVHTAGDYKLPLVYGNAIKDGAANTAAYTGIENANTTLDFPNHAGTAINAPWITKATSGEGVNKGMGITVASAELLWQDAQGLITAVGISGDYLTLTVGKNATAQQGNAVVAAKDGSGNIVWSWHIWVTTETFADATLTTVATGSHDYKVTPVNLGWVPTGGEGKQGYAPYYQWGRKDPFKAQGAPADLTVYNISNTAVTGLTYEASNATIADNIMNPTKFYNGMYGPCNTQYYNMWDAQQTGTDNITTATVKTVYDPCPAGFCVPTGNLYYFMGNGISRSMTTWDGTNKGATWDNTVVDGSITGNALFFPASGCRYNSGSLSNVGSIGYYWSASPNSSDNGSNLFFKWNGWSWNSVRRAAGFPVRAVKE